MAGPINPSVRADTKLVTLITLYWANTPPSTAATLLFSVPPAPCVTFNQGPLPSL